MSIYENATNKFESGAYAKTFNELLRKTNTVSYNALSEGNHGNTGSYALPAVNKEQYDARILKESVFRNLATVVYAPRTDSTIRTYDVDDVATWLSDDTLGRDEFHVGADTFHTFTVGCHRLGTILRLSNDFVYDSGFDIGKYVATSFAKKMAHNEDNAFINGTGSDMPIGILNATGGANVGVMAASTTVITYDEVIKLFFSVKPEYRDGAVWLMNDTTALALRTLKDENGNYLWNQATDTILGKKVVISNYMPNPTAGKKAIAFGDFSYYWIVERLQFTVLPMCEKYAPYNQVAYLGYEHMDGKLIRAKAIKVLQMKAQ